MCVLSFSLTFFERILIAGEPVDGDGNQQYYLAAKNSFLVMEHFNGGIKDISNASTIY